MPLTSYQKKYIKNNHKKLSVQEIAFDLKLAEKEVENFFKKHGLSRIMVRNLEVKVFSFSEGFNFNNFFLKNLYFILLLFILVFIVYFNSFDNQFVSDDSAIWKNPKIGQFSEIFSSPFGIIQRLLYFLIFSIFGLTPDYYRIPFVILHFLSSILVFITVFQIAKSKKIAHFSSLLFAIHPILVESVSWISGSPYVLYSFFFLLSFLLFINSENDKKKYYISIFFFFCAISVSEKAIPLIFVFPLTRYLFLNGKDIWKKSWPFFLEGIFMAILYLSNVGKRISNLENIHYQDSSGFQNPLVQIPIAIFNYLKLIIWPQNLTLYHTDLAVTWTQYAFILIVFLAFIGGIALSYKKNKQIFFWLLFFIITLLPTLTPLKIAWVVAERYVYLGSIGIFVVIAMFFSWLTDKKVWKKYAYVFFSIFILAFSIRTIVRNMDWQNEDTLWIATAKVSENGPNIHNNLGDLYSRQGNYEKALEEFKKATEINPRYADAFHNIGITYLKLGENDLAAENFQKAISLNPNIWYSYQQLAGIYYYQENFGLALEYIKKAIAISPNEPELQDNLKIIQQAYENKDK